MNESLLLPGVFAVAFLYSSVGHGGASGYLALMALSGFAASGMKAGALLLNLLVAGISFWAFRRARHFEWRLFWPFAVTSIPCSFLGGLLSLPPQVYGLLLAGTLAWTAWRLTAAGVADDPAHCATPKKSVAMGTGAGLGLLSGMVGVGGGIFLSPLMILLRWGDTKRVAAVSALFIWVNSAAGLLGHLVRGRSLPAMELAFVGAALAGGLAGSHLGARRFTSPTLRALLSAVLLMASYKLAANALR